MSLSNLSHHKLLSADMGKLIPVGLYEVLPGDKIRHQTAAMVRTAALNAPVMHKVDVRIHHFFVPNRIIWDDWEDFITRGRDGTDTPVFPTIELDDETGAVGTLADYLGIPTVPTTVPETILSVSALPFRAYAYIFNEWYRDQDIVDPVPLSIASGLDTTTNLDLLQHAWERDYFTSARPEAQKGPEVVLNLTGDAPVKYQTFSGNTAANDKYAVLSQGTAPTHQERYGNEIGVDTAYVPNDSKQNMFADLSAVTGISINALREAAASQRMLERSSRRGSRYQDLLKAAFGVTVPDYRLDLPEMLGGSKQVIQFSEVLQTAEGTNPVGTLRGHGLSAMRSNRFNFRCPEHGHVITLMSFRPKTMYMQALDKLWSRRSSFDFFDPMLQHIGNQPIQNKELYAFHTEPDGIFGWTKRYGEYTSIPSKVCGEFKTTSLNYWHMARDFASDPALNEDFIQCTPTERIYQSTSVQPLWVMVNHTIAAKRKVLTNPEPKLL